MHQYLALMQNILDHGYKKRSRGYWHALSMRYQMRFDLQKVFSLL